MAQEQERWQRLNTLLEAALEMSEPERRRFIARECRGDAALQAELQELLRFDDDKTGGLYSAIDEVAKQAVPSLSADQAGSGNADESGSQTSAGQQPQALKKGDRIGQFEIQRLLGSGGMGEVYEAMQLAPVQRAVAIKLIRHGSHDPAVMARFDSERQTLALMSHPAIATVHDAGYAPDGRPYFAMELVDGVPVDKYLREHDLSLQDTLALLISICRGVQHAHQRGVIHRDLKPSNILVIEQDGKPTPKLIDFGIAKAAATASLESADLTQVGQLIGTLRYMSPEQADSMGVDVDTRSDVYAVGTIFYEILTGRHPLNIEALASASIVERQREFQESSPSVPSRITNSQSPAAFSAAELKGDLDWILLKALRKNRERRYGSVGELARDLERHLNNEPVEAGPPTASYRWSKFYRRNRIGVLAAAAVTASVVVGIALGTLGLVRALAAEQEAVQQAVAAEEVSQFLVGLFEASDPNKGGSPETSARELLDRGAQQLDGRLDKQPITKAHLLQTLGNVYEILGLLNESFDKRLEASELLAGANDVDALDHASVLTDLSVGYRRRGDFQEAHDTAERALALVRDAPGENGVAQSYTLNALGVAKIMLADFDAAEPVMRQSLDVVSIAAPGSAAHATSAYNLAGLYNFMGRSEEAIPFIQEAIDIRLAIDPGAPRIGDMYDGLGILHLSLGQLDEAVTSLQQGLDARRQSFGDSHYLVAMSLQNLSEAHYFGGDDRRAAALAAESVASSERAEGDVEWRIVAAQYELLAITSAHIGELQTAYDAVARAKQLRAEFTPADHPDALLAEHAEAVVMLEEERYPEAVERLERVFEHRRASQDSVSLDIQEPLIRANLLAGQMQRAVALCQMLKDGVDLQTHPQQRFAKDIASHCSAAMQTQPAV